jgi:hypothetical protein
MSVSLLVRVRCNARECIDAVDVEAAIQASIQSGGSVEIELAPDLPPGWISAYGGTVHYCREHRSEAL